jgi:DNA-binding beta-propeller fold protein YncE
VYGGIVTDGDDVWVAGGTNVPSRVLRIDATSNRVIATINTGGGTGIGVAADYGAIWITGTGNGSATGYRFLLRLDPLTNQIVGKIGLGAAPFSVATGAGGIWVTIPDEGRVIRLAPA